MGDVYQKASAEDPAVKEADAAVCVASLAVEEGYLAVKEARTAVSTAVNATTVDAHHVMFDALYDVLSAADNALAVVQATLRGAKSVKRKKIKEFYTRAVSEHWNSENEQCVLKHTGRAMKGSFQDLKYILSPYAAEVVPQGEDTIEFAVRSNNIRMLLYANDRDPDWTLKAIRCVIATGCFKWLKVILNNATDLIGSQRVYGCLELTKTGEKTLDLIAATGDLQSTKLVIKFLPSDASEIWATKTLLRCDINFAVLQWGRTHFGRYNNPCTGGQYMAHQITEPGSLARIRWLVVYGYPIEIKTIMRLSYLKDNSNTGEIWEWLAANSPQVLLNNKSYVEFLHKYHNYCDEDTYRTSGHLCYECYTTSEATFVRLANEKMTSGETQDIRDHYRTMIEEVFSRFVEKSENPDNILATLSDELEEEFQAQSLMSCYLDTCVTSYQIRYKLSWHLAIGNFNELEALSNCEWEDDHIIGGMSEDLYKNQMRVKRWLTLSNQWMSHNHIGSYGGRITDYFNDAPV